MRIMRISWNSPLVQALVVVPCLGFAILAWPVVVIMLLESLHRVRPMYDDDMEGIFTILAMLPVGLAMAIHAGTMIKERTLWLRSKAKRTTFLILSGLFAACITYVNSIGGIDDQKGPMRYVLTYFLTVQALPLLWFLYNLHGESWLKAIARLRNRRTL